MKKSLQAVTTTLLYLSLSLPWQTSNAESLTQKYINYRENLNALTPKVLKQAINAYLYAVKNNEAGDKSILTIVNFTVPSFKRRMWVIDTSTGDVLLSMHVAQGKNTGKVYAKHFSNRPGSDQSSPGIYTTTYQYVGEHGKSMRLKGLEKGINNNAMQRAIVVHPAWYVSPSFINKYGYAGRSWGCFAFNPKRSPKFLKTIKDHTVLFAYAPSEDKDPNVNHALSTEGQAIYNRIKASVTGKQTAQSPGAFSQFLGNIKSDIKKI